MEIKEIKVDGYKKVMMATDSASGLKAIISVHNTSLGPAVGGTRLYPYANEDEALEDVLRLSKGMTYKSSLAGVNFGGGKSVIIANPAQKSPALLKAFGAFVDSYEGTYNCAEDVNTSVKDMEIIHEVTNHVMGLKNKGGDPSPLTALGVFVSIKATAEKKLGKKLSETHVAVQGVGHVGMHLVKMLHKEGAKISIADLNQEQLAKISKKTGATIVDTETIHATECHIFAPCAMGAILNEKTIPQLNCKAIVGAANNQMATDADAAAVAKRGILYAPDYLVNAGGIINVFIEQSEGGYDAQKADTATRNIANTLMDIFDMAEAQNILPSQAADKIAEKRFLESK
ncbi:MAG: leucine dehydrogenase [Alphaproteobacteria bacterium]|jgi:leucine dehydrogenase